MQSHCKFDKIRDNPLVCVFIYIIHTPHKTLVPDHFLLDIKCTTGNVQDVLLHLGSALLQGV